MSTPTTPAPQSAPSAAAPSRVSVADQLAALVGKPVRVFRFGGMMGMDFTGTLEELPPKAEVGFFTVKVGAISDLKAATVLFSADAVRDISGGNTINLVV